MTQTLANRMTTAPDQVFFACNPLQAREKMLEGHQMAEAHGGTPLFPIILAGAAGGIIATVVTNPQQAVETVDWYVDRASEACDFIGDFISDTYDSFISDLADGMTNIGYGDGW